MLQLNPQNTVIIQILGLSKVALTSMQKFLQHASKECLVHSVSLCARGTHISSCTFGLKKVLV